MRGDPAYKLPANSYFLHFPMSLSISWHGLATCTITGPGVTIITDPAGPTPGLKAKRLSGDVVLASTPAAAVAAVRGIGDAEPFIITGPGEYEVKGAFIYGAAAPAAGNQPAVTVYRLELDHLAVVYLGLLDGPLGESVSSLLERTDVLILPVGGLGALTPEAAKAVIASVEPRIVVPIRYALPGLKLRLEPLAKACAALGLTVSETVPKLKVSRKDLPADSLRLVVVEPT